MLNIKKSPQKRKIAAILALTLTLLLPINALADPEAPEGSAAAVANKQIIVTIKAPETENTVSQPTVSSIDLSQYSETGIPYRRFEELNLPFDAAARKSAPTFYSTGEYYAQGINQYGYQGTCSEAAEATTMNILFDTNAYTENVFVDCAVKSGNCTTGDVPEANGGQSPIQMREVFEKVGNYTGDKVIATYAVLGEVPPPDELDGILGGGSVIVMSVDSFILWDMTPEEVAAAGAPNYYVSNHWIVLKSVVKDEAGNIRGVNIVDSSGYNVTYVDLVKYATMVYGPTGSEVQYPACVIVTKKQMDKAEIQAFRDKVNGKTTKSVSSQ